MCLSKQTHRRLGDVWPDALHLLLRSSKHGTCGQPHSFPGRQVPNCAGMILHKRAGCREHGCSVSGVRPEDTLNS